MVYPKSRIPPAQVKENNLHSAEFRVKRDEIIEELDKVFVVYGNPTVKDTVGIEEHLFHHSKTQDEYLAMAMRLVRIMPEMAQLRRTRAGSLTTSLNQQSRPEQEVQRRVAEAFPLSILSTSVTQRQPAVSTTQGTFDEPATSSEQPVDVVRSISRKRVASSAAEFDRRSPAVSDGELPAFLFKCQYLAISDRQKAVDGARVEKADSIRAESVQSTAARVVDEEGGADPVDVFMTFQVPKGYNMKNIKVRLEKNPV